MPKRANERTTTYVTSVLSPEGREHVIKLEMWYTLAESGIGWYEFWGEHCYDRGQVGIDDYGVIAAYLSRTREAAHYDDIPKIRGVWDIQRGSNTDGWVYTHHWELPAKHWAVEMAADDFSDNYQDWDLDEDYKED